MQQLVNTHLGQYQLLEVIGSGAAATVYRAYQPALRRYVAVKVLRPHIDSSFAVRFRREAQAVAVLQHPHILPIYDVGQVDDLHYFVMQLIENGTTLADSIAGPPIDMLRAIQLVTPLLDALAYAHRQGIIHRDVKPSNIVMFRSDWPLLADFGIAKSINESQQLTPPGTAIGTAAYMAPELAQSLTATARSDMYSVGVMLYEMVTGQLPFDGSTPLAVLLKHVHDPVLPPRRLNPAVPQALEAIILRALEKDPDRRFQTAEEMQAALQRVQAQIGQQPAPAQLQPMLAARIAPVVDPYQTRDLDSPDASPSAGTMQTMKTRPLTATHAPHTRHVARHGWLRRNAFLALALLIGGLIAALLALNGLSTRSPQVEGQGSAAPTPKVEGQESAAPTPRYGVLPGEKRENTPVPAPSTTVADPEINAPVPTSSPLEQTDPAIEAAAERTLRLEDDAWEGGYGGVTRRRSYGGRTAIWVYGTATEYSTMRTTFEVAGQPEGQVTLTVEGMDSEDSLKTPIRIMINGVEIFSGPNPLPNDDKPLESGTWTSYSWTCDGSLLQPGQNQMSISNQAHGAFSLPPFFMLDYADITYTAS